MKTYMLAQLQLRYGAATLRRYNETMVTIQKLFEEQGVRLLHGMVTRVGRLYEVWNLWEVDDQGHVARALTAIHQHPEAPQVAQALAEIVEHENVRFLESLPFSPHS